MKLFLFLFLAIASTASAHICKYDCPDGCSSCKGSEPNSHTWCSASKDHCEDGKPAPNQGGGCGGLYCADDTPAPVTYTKVESDPTSKNCAYGCPDGCPLRRKGETPGPKDGGCASYESGNSWCNLSAENCERCKTKDYGKGEWCPAEQIVAAAAPEPKAAGDVQYEMNIAFTKASDAGDCPEDDPDCHEHCCSYHCAHDDCSKCTGWEPNKPTWCNASRQNCESGPPAPNSGGGCGGTWCPGKCPGPVRPTPPPTPAPSPNTHKCGYYCQGNCGDCVSFSDSEFCNESAEHCTDFCKGTYCKVPTPGPSKITVKCGFSCNGDEAKCTSFSHSRFCQLDKANCEGPCKGTAFPLDAAKGGLRASSFLRAMFK